MAFPDEITLDNGTTQTEMTVISRLGAETLRRNATRGLVFPKTMRIAHQAVKAAVGGKANRALVRLDDIQNYDVEDPAAKAGEAVYIVIQRPEVLTSPDNIRAMVAELCAFCTSANITKLLNGES